MVGYVVGSLCAARIAAGKIEGGGGGDGWSVVGKAPFVNKCG